jgi:hypothetical protein
MKRETRLWKLVLVFVAALCGGHSAANASWPTDGIRTISGTWCKKLGTVWACPFIADGNYGYEDNLGVLVDYHVSGNANGSSIVSVCWRSGGSITCVNDGNPATPSGIGVKNVAVSGFGYNFVASVWDYYFVEIQPLPPPGGGALPNIDQVYGVTYVGWSP